MSVSQLRPAGLEYLGQPVDRVFVNIVDANRLAVIQLHCQAFDARLGRTYARAQAPSQFGALVLVPRREARKILFPPHYFDNSHNF